MKKRLLSLLLAVCTVLSLVTAPAAAAGTAKYSDVTDSATSTTAESLRLMGVMDGYTDGTFRPQAQLNRAQFCKMATYAMNRQGQLGLYRTVTVFPDVKPSYWASAYINLCARTSVNGGNTAGAEGEGSGVAQAVIAGFPDGRFHPERPVTMGQAVTILLRILGYQDSQIGGVWPDSFLATAKQAGLLKGLTTVGNAPLTRGQAAKLFVNLLEAKTPGGTTLYTLSEETELSTVDGGAGVMKTLDGKTYSMANPVSETTLTGMKGRVVLSGDIALTFLPVFGNNTGSAAGAIVVYEDGSSAGFESLAGNSGYRIYKNGTPATTSDLRKYDVATYYPATNSIIVTDSRVTAYYESCEPNPNAPTKIQVFGGTEFYVLPTAADSMRELRPGDMIVLLLTADGRVASAVKSESGAPRGNAIGLVTPEGNVELLCGNTTISLNVKAEEAMFGKVVRVSATSKDKVDLSEARGGKIGTLNIADKTLGRIKLADGVVIFEEGRQVSLNHLNRSEIPADQIRFARTNWANEVDLVVIDRTTDERYGRVFWDVERIPAVEEGSEDELIEKIGVEYDNGQRTEAFKMKYNVASGDFVAYKLNRGGTGFSQMIKLAQLKSISWNSWIGNDTVNAGGRNYEVPANVQCYNAGSKEWITLEQAKAYADTANLYVKDGVVRIVEVK